MITHRHIHCTKPDIVIKEKETAKCMVIDVAIPSDYNIQKKTTEKMSKYVDLYTECERMWSIKVEVIPVTIGATGIVSKNLKKIPEEDTRKPQCLQHTEISNPWNSRHCKESVIHQVRIKQYTSYQPCQSKK